VETEIAKSDMDGQRPRKSERVPLKAEVQLRRTGNHSYMVDVQDVSPEGCKVEFVERPRLDETVWVKFDRMDAIESHVVWVEGFSAGVEFLRPIYPAVFQMLVERLQP
jgi:hypothetical protein